MYNDKVAANLTSQLRMLVPPVARNKDRLSPGSVVKDKTKIISIHYVLFFGTKKLLASIILICQFPRTTMPFVLDLETHTFSIFACFRFLCL